MKKEEIMELVPTLLEEDATALSELFDEELKKSSIDEEKIREEAKEEALLEARKEFSEKERENAIRNAIESANSKSSKALTALIDLSEVEFSDGKITGLSEQIEKLKTECGFLFFDTEKEKPKFTKGPAPFENRIDLSGLSYKERLRLYREMPEVYRKLAK